MDYHCPYSQRVVLWLDDLGPERVAVRHRLFGLEQVNRDPGATDWRLWEQPLDYIQYRERQDRRSLAAFLATAIVEANEARGVAARFRRAVYEARFQDRADISDLMLLDSLAAAAGAAAGRVADGFSRPAELATARVRIADDWAAARSSFAIFGVPTLGVGGARPFYLRLAGPVEPADGPAVLDALLDFRSEVPGVLELKLPEPI
ncbi:MAG: DSBA-like thioredoxin domain, partial [Chloroflexi bacterium]|nr:DSBA-like thioredoxin domain [Chloroflexota bacterium]